MLMLYLDDCKQRTEDVQLGIPQGVVIFESRMLMLS